MPNYKVIYSLNELVSIQDTAIEELQIVQHSDGTLIHAIVFGNTMDDARAAAIRLAEEAKAQRAKGDTAQASFNEPTPSA